MRYHITKDITADMINVISVNVARRLSNTRLLAAGYLKVVYEVIVPSTFSGQAFTAASIDKTALKSAVVTQAQASGMSSFAVTSLTVKAPIGRNYIPKDASSPISPKYANTSEDICTKYATYMHKISKMF